MALDFPSNPTNGQVYDNFIYSSAKGTWKSLSAGASPSIITNAVISATASNATTVPLTVNGAVSQSANLQEWKDSSGLIKAKINKSGATMVRNLESYNTASDVRTFFIGDDLAGQVEIGRTDGVAAEPYIDFHSGATVVDYDSRIIASGGNGTVGGGNLSLYGKITMPNQPCYYGTINAYGSSSNYYPATTDTFNIGFSKSGNNRLTISSAGKYYIAAQQLVNTAGTSCYFNIYKNGATVAYAYSNADDTYDVTVSALINLAANDYIEIYYSGTTSNSWGAPHSSYSVFKVS